MATLKPLTTLIKNTARTGIKYITKYSPTILTILGVGMMGSATIQAIIEAPKAKDELDILERNESLTHKEYAKEKRHIIFNHYWPTTVLVIGGAGMIFWGHRITLAQTAAAITAYNLKADELEKWKKKIAELDGDKRIGKLEEDILRDEVKDGPTDEGAVINTGHGKMLCYEVTSGRYFYSDIEKIRKANNDINDWINDSKQYGEEIDVSLNEWFDYLGLERTKTGNKLGWHNQLIRLNFTSLLTVNGVPCLCVGYKDPPVWEFDMRISDRGISSDDWCDRAPDVL